MRTNTPCFNSFIKLLSDSYDITVTSKDYSLGVNGIIDYWKDVDVEKLAFVYSQGWNDAAINYKCF